MALTRAQITARRTARQARQKARRVPLPRHPVSIERSYLSKVLRPVVALVRELTNQLLIPRLEALTALARRGDARRDASGDDLRAIIDTLRAQVEAQLTANRIGSNVREVGAAISKYQGDELQKQVKAGLGVEVPLSDDRLSPRLRDFTNENVRLIQSIPADTLNQVERLVLNGMQAGTRWEDLADEIADRFDVSESRAALIARDQVGKFYGTTARVRQEELGVTSYVWRTSLDERVRPEHAAREGEVFEWSEPPEDGPPGIPINCRCTAEPVIEDLLNADTPPEEEEDDGT